MNLKMKVAAFHVAMKGCKALHPDMRYYVAHDMAQLMGLAVTRCTCDNQDRVYLWTYAERRNGTRYLLCEQAREVL
jgi:hypothetical protein